MEKGGTASLAEKLSREPTWMQHPFAEKCVRNLPIAILLGFLFLLYGYFLAHKIDLTTADLGRHIKNGEIMLQDSSVLRTNYYSYTEPDFPVVNHHWGSGLLFYLAWRLGGFVGVHLFFILLSLAALAVFLAAARLYSAWGIIGFAVLLAIPLLGERTEIRPEVFSYLFAGVFFLILSAFREVCHPRGGGDPGNPRDGIEKLDSSFRWNHKKKHEKLLWLLPLVQIIWVNTHIYFLLGPPLVGAFLLESAIQYRARFTKLFSVFVAVVAATLVNPLGYRAVTEAATLFQNFGYRLAENQSIWFLERLGMSDPNFLLFKIALAALALSFVVAAFRNWKGVHLSHFFVAVGISILALFASRNLALFGLFSISVIAANMQTAFGQHLHGGTLRWAATGLVGAALVISVIFALPRYFPYWRAFGFGLEAGNDAAAEFIQTQSVRGPLFNNYDIGGYLIFHLFPTEKVFVDNRPEAYPAEFFQKVYIPMQEDESVWREMLLKYRFNAIVFSYHDATPWGQQFLVSRIKDPEWAPVFVDSKVLVFVRRRPENEVLIKRFELSRELFRTSS